MASEFIPVGPFDIVIFGGTGDLSKRKLLPALFHRFLDGQLDSTCKVIGIARSKMTRENFQQFAKEACQAASEEFKENQWGIFAEHLDYIGMDATSDDADWRPLKDILTFDDRPIVFYLATTPLIYVAICEALRRAELNKPQMRLVLEKPIGTDQASAKLINDGTGAVFDENAIYRIDHYLGKETVQNLMVLRFSNSLFEAVWSHQNIDSIQITVAEDIGLEGRADYYNRSGALRDMVQNHILQLLCLTTMEPPNSLDADSVRAEKIKVLKALKPFTNETIKTQTIRGQYTSGFSQGGPVQGYTETLSDVYQDSQTETYVALRTEIENYRWAGVPIYLRTGKRMASRRSDIVIQFKPPNHSPFGQVEKAPNRLVIRLQPAEGMRLFLDVKEPGAGGMRIKSLPLNLSYADNFIARYPDAYERLLMDVVRGNLSLFMRRDEVENAWAWVDQLLAAWEKSEHPLSLYRAGTEGPQQANDLFLNDGEHWWEPEDNDA